MIKLLIPLKKVIKAKLYMHKCSQIPYTPGFQSSLTSFLYQPHLLKEKENINKKYSQKNFNSFLIKISLQKYIYVNI